MSSGHIQNRLISAILVCLLPICLSPALAETGTAALTGVVLDAGTRSPIPGVQVHVADPATERFFVSDATGADGTFKVDGLPAASYEIGLQRDGGLYLVRNRVNLAPGQNHLVEVSLAVEDDEESDDTAATFWQNPLTAALAVAGSAIVIGVLLEHAVEDDEPVRSPLVP